MCRALVNADDQDLCTLWATYFFLCPFLTSNFMFNTNASRAQCALNFAQFIRQQPVAFRTRKCWRSDPRFNGQFFAHVTPSGSHFLRYLLSRLQIHFFFAIKAILEGKKFQGRFNSIPCSVARSSSMRFAPTWSREPSS